MTFADLQNFVLSRLRQRGVNFGAPPTNVATDFNPPYEVALALNNAYNEFLRATLDYRIATIDVDFLTTTGKISYSLNPLPNAYGGAIRPAIMQVYEFRYIYGSGANVSQERYIPSISSVAFRAFTGAYTQRYGALAGYPYRVCQQYGMREIDLFPGTATTGDTIRLFACPDPLSTEAAYPGGQIPASAGGILVNPTDVPLIAPEFHLALVYHATAFLCGQADKQTGQQINAALYSQKVDEAQEFGAATMEGDAEQRVFDIYPDSAMM
jgi:hypothetical protein